MQITANIVDVLNERIFHGTVTVEDGKIVEIEPLAAPQPSLPYLLPGLVDSHIHIESTLLLPEQYAPRAMRHGVLAAVCDPHEIANVLGMEGVDYMIESGRKTTFHFLWMAPSCVPSTPFETAGATIDAQGVAALLDRDEVGGLAEMMNVPGVLGGDPEVQAKIDYCKRLGKPIDGHAPALTGEDAKRYCGMGITTDHECVSVAIAEERIAMGMKILIREGSASCDFESLAPLLGKYRTMLMLCSDDMYADDFEQGYIDAMVRRALAKGYPLWNVLRAASITPVLHYNLHMGLLRKGDNADFILVDNLSDFNVLASYIEGNMCRCADSQPALPNNFHAQPITPEVLVREAEGKVKVMVASEGSLYTRCELSEFTPEVNKLVVINRYEPHAQPAVAFIKGFHLRQGAMASTIAHDSHNIIAVGADNQSIALAINTLIEHKGGIAVTDGSTVDCLPLPIAGLMSPLSCEEVGIVHKRLRAKAQALGCPFSAPFMTLAFMALPVIPELKLTDKGLFDANKFEFTAL